VPQAELVVPCWQTPFWQQPLAQLVGPHTLTQLPFWHVVPAGQATQVTPLLPQAAFVLPALQVWVVASQQPLGQLAGVHTQL
jgi:hypothetical protein